MKKRLGIGIILTSAIIIGFLSGCIKFRFNNYGLAELEFFRQKVSLTSKYDDGPYIVKEGDKWLSLEVVRGEARRSEVDMELPGFSEVAVFNGVEHLAVVSDIHGQYELLLQLLQSNAIIDEQENWIFGKGHLVILGDVFDRGHAVTECLWLIYSLQQQAEKSGGRVHYVLGNHEYMVLNDDLAFVNPKYFKTAEALGMAYSDLFAENTFFGQWIRQCPAMLKINDYLLVHAGISEAILNKGWTVEEVNQNYRKALAGEIPELGDFLLGPFGLLWYRGFIQDENYEKVVMEILKQYNVSALFYGHTTFPHVQKRYNGKLLLVDAGMKYGTHAEIVLIQHGKVSVRNQTGQEVILD